MTRFAYFCGHEQWQPEVLVEHAVLAEDAGFDFLVVRYDTNGGTLHLLVSFNARSGGSLTFTPGVTSQVFSITILPDDLYEGDETAGLSLHGVSGADLPQMPGQRGHRRGCGLRADAYDPQARCIRYRSRLSFRPAAQVYSGAVAFDVGRGRRGHGSQGGARRDEELPDIL